VDDITTAEIYDAATVGGARALKRPDLGRLIVGGKADIVVVDTKHPAMMPLREPIRSLIYVAAERVVRDVWVGGEQVVADGKPLLIDYAEVSEALERAQARSLEAVPKHDWAGRTADELEPMVLPVAPRQ